MKLSVHYLPQFISDSDLAESVVVVVDLLRASTTICHALAAGAVCVIPCTEVDETLSLAARLGRENVLLGGERGGLKIEGFDFGNSPTEYTADQVFGRKVIFTTTNGTRALAHAHLASRVFVGATVNRMSVVETVQDAPRVDILCAGTGGSVTREDILAAGSMVDALLVTAAEGKPTLNEWAEAAHREWQELINSARALGRSLSQQFAQELIETPGGRDLIAVGHDYDLETCAQLDALELVPELDHATGQITLR